MLNRLEPERAVDAHNTGQGPLLVTFAGGDSGGWLVERVAAVRGEGLAMVERLAVLEGGLAIPGEVAWVLRGVTSNLRYTTEAERRALVAMESQLGRAEATRAALIPIRKNDRWWSLAQDQRRTIFEERSRHVSTGLQYLPAVARRLHHCRDLEEPFDFLTWFEFAPADAAAFDELVARLRETEEWSYVEREVDIRLVRAQ